jgi:hypothetical protein
MLAALFSERPLGQDPGTMQLPCSLGPLAGPLALALLALHLPGSGQDSPRLVLVGLDGTENVLGAEGLDLTDPRTRGAWVVRPVGFPPPLPAAGSSGPVGPRVVLGLHAGDELRGTLSGGQGESLELTLVGDVRLPVDIAEIATVDFPDTLDPAVAVSLAGASEGDRLYRDTGSALDPVDGTIEGFSAEGVAFLSVLGARTIPWAEVAALRIEALEDVAPGASERPPVQVDLVDGSRLRGGLVALRGDRCVLELGVAHEVALPLGAITELVVADGRLRHLSELEPTGEEGRGTPFDDDLGMIWPHRMDSSVTGRPLTCAGRVWRRGIGMHAPSRLTFALDGSWKTLSGRVGIDDSTRINDPEARGRVVFRIWIDGKKAWESVEVRGGNAPLAIEPVDLAGVKTLVLEVDPVGDFFGDRADWLGPILVR